MAARAVALVAAKTCGGGIEKAVVAVGKARMENSSANSILVMLMGGDGCFSLSVQR